MTHLAFSAAAFAPDGLVPPLEEVVEAFNPIEWLEKFQMPMKESPRQTLLNWRDNGPVLRKLVLPSNSVLEFRDLLHRDKVTSANLMPTLDNIAKVASQQALDEARRGSFKACG